MKSFHSLKGGARKVLPCLEGGGCKNVSDPRFSHFVPPLPVNNDQSLRSHPHNGVKALYSGSSAMT